MPGFFALAIIIWLILRNIKLEERDSPRSYIVIALALKFMVLLVAISVFLNADPSPIIVALFTLVLCVNWLPTCFLEWIVVPLGLPRLAYWIVLLSWPLDLARNIRAGAALYAALAISRCGATPKLLNLLEAKLKKLPANDASSGVAAALLADLSGNAVLARNLMQHADNQTMPGISRKAKMVARHWLIDLAARSANWQEVIAIAARDKRGGRWSNIVTHIAMRLLGQAPAKRDWVLCLIWLSAPYRLSTLPLLRLALNKKPLAAVADQASPAPESLAQALAELLRTLENVQSMLAAEFINALQAVEMQLDRADTSLGIARRLHALGAPPEPAQVVQRFRQRLVEIILPLIETSPHLAREADHVPCIMEAKAQARLKLFRDIEVRCQDYGTRTNGNEILSPIAEWSNWTTLCDIAERLLALDPSAEDSLFQATFHQVCNFAVYLHNKRNNKSLAHDMFAWLHSHCKTDMSAAALLAKNMRAV